jgi:hypothetical protein
MGEKSEHINDIYETIQHQFKNVFFTGYAQGHENGYDSGIMDVKMKLMVKLAVHTDLDDNTILKVLEKEQDEGYIKALNEIRERQKNEREDV